METQTMACRQNRRQSVGLDGNENRNCFEPAIFRFRPAEIAATWRWDKRSGINLSDVTRRNWLSNLSQRSIKSVEPLR